MNAGAIAPEQLAVTARGSAMSYQASSKGLAAIGSELAVDYVLQGSVRRTGARAPERTVGPGLRRRRVVGDELRHGGAR